MNPTKSGNLTEKLVKIKRQRDELLKAAKDVVLQYRNFDDWVSISGIEKFEEIIGEIEVMGKAKGDGEMKVTLLRDMETSNHKFIKGEVGRIVEYPLEHASTDLVKVWANGKDLICAREDLKFWKDDK